MANPLPALDVLRHELGNGLVVLLAPDRSLPLVAVNVNYHVGSKDERPGRTGFAHLFEHLMFEGSAHWPRDFFEAFADIGGEVNGATSTDRTRYWELLPSQHLERAIWLEADRMGFLLEALTPERLNTQIGVVQNERRQSYENRPYGTARERITMALYPPDHPYHWPTIGFMSDIAAATLDDAREFFRTFYRPSNASICIAGDLDEDAALAMVERHFGGLEPTSRPPRLRARPAALAGRVQLEIEDRVQLPRSYQTWHSAPLFAPDDAALDALAHVLGGGRTSRLYRRLVHDLEIAQDAVAFQASAELSGSFGVILSPKPGRSLDELEAAAEEVLAELLDRGPTEEELERIKTATTAAMVRSLQQIGRFGGRSDRLNEYLHYLGRADAYRWDLQRTLDLTVEQVREAGRRYLGAARVVARVVPAPARAASRSQLAVSVDRASAPAPGPARLPRLPERERFRIDGGPEVLLVSDRRLPLVSLAVALRSGTAADPSDLDGLSSLTNALLQEGAAGRSAEQIAAGLEAIGAELSISTTSDAAVVRVSALRERAADAADVLTDLVLRPDFPEAEVERLRRRRLVQLVQLADQPSYLAARAFARAVFARHPYGATGIGTRASLTAIDRESIVAWWRARFQPDEAVLLAVGDIARNELEDLLGPRLVGWLPQPRSAESLAAPETRGPRSIMLLDRPGSPQSVIVAGHLGIARTDPEHAALTLANAVLGGQFVSRLNRNLREDKGLTYGVRSRVETGRSAGSFQVTTSVETPATASAVHEIVAELAAIAGPRPPSPEELAQARGHLVDGVARRFETQGQILQALLDLAAYGLPDEEWERELEALRSCALERVAGAAMRLIDPDHLSIVVVGDAAAVRPALESLDLGPILGIEPET